MTEICRPDGCGSGIRVRRRAKRGEQAELMVDDMKEGDSLDRTIPRLPVGTFSICARRERSDKPTAFASAGENVCWR